MDEQVLRQLNAALPALNRNLINCISSTDLECTRIDEDFNTMAKNFHDISEAARKYLREQIKKPYIDMENVRKSLEDKCRILEAKFHSESNYNQREGVANHAQMNSINLRNEAQYLIVEIEKLNMLIDQKTMSPIRYKHSDHSKRVFNEVQKIFYKYLKNMYRKFKGFLDDVTRKIDDGILREVNSFLKEMDDSRESLNNTINSMVLGNEQKTAIAQEIIRQSTMINASMMKDITGLAHPSSLKNIERFPDLKNAHLTDENGSRGPNANYTEALKRYDEFNLPKKINHSSFQDLKNFGPQVLEDGTIYEGQWKDCKRVGLGKALYKRDPNDVAFSGLYAGYWVDDKPGLIGRMIDENGEVYEGFIESGKAHGKGIHIKLDNYRYVGFFHEDQKHGYGEETNPNSTVYKGDFFLNRHQGRGCLMLPDGSCYDGDFFDNKFSGYGKFTWANNEKYNGEWSDDKKHGKGIYTYEDGQEYHGDFINDIPHGFGELLKPDGTLYKGFWDKGIPIGVGLGMKDDMKTVGHWQNGDFTGWGNSSLNKEQESLQNNPKENEDCDHLKQIAENLEMFKEYVKDEDIDQMNARIELQENQKISE